MSNPDLIYQRYGTNGRAVVSLMVMGAIVYGPFLGSAGFYWDDWPVVSQYSSHGVIGLTQYFAGERPVAGWLDEHLFSVFGLHAMNWQVFSLTLRCLSAIAVYAVFNLLWPTVREIAWTAGAFFLVYPGFTQQAISLTYTPHQLSWLLFLLSLTGVLLSIRFGRYRIPLTLAAVSAEACGYLLTEYFTGLELIRPVCIFFALRQIYPGSAARLKGTVLRWMPYAMTWFGYLFFRLFVFSATVRYKDVRVDLTNIVSDPSHQILLRLWTGIHNVTLAAIGAWCRPFVEDAIAPSSRAVLLSWLPAMFVVGVSVYTLRHMGGTSEIVADQKEGEESKRIQKSGIVLTAVGLLTAGLPFIMSGLRTEFELQQPSYEDRFDWPFMLPASLGLICVIRCVGRSRRTRLVLVCAVLFICSAYQVQKGLFYRREWLRQKAIFWQLAWRAPALAKGTSVFAYGLPKSLYRNHTAGMLDLLYEGNVEKSRMNYFIFDLGRSADESPSLARLGYDPQEPVSGEVRSFVFQGRADQSVVVSISPAGTLRLVNPEEPLEVPECNTSCLVLTRISHPEELIRDSPARRVAPLLAIFGQEPNRDWLYFFQKAELERQLQHWAAVATLADEANRQGYKPVDASEWFPFIEGYARVRKFDVAEQLSERIVTKSADLCSPMALLWERMEREGAVDAAESDRVRGICRKASAGS
ncbi:MAG: hypothetical protein JWM54_1213 [Acidobacteriaceae bacterium]|nr:hypothetical protein [Acidobacteriaceae bacterium]